MEMNSQIGVHNDVPAAGEWIQPEAITTVSTAEADAVGGATDRSDTTEVLFFRLPSSSTTDRHIIENSGNVSSHPLNHPFDE